MVTVGRLSYQCSVARGRGDSICDNRKTIKIQVIEDAFLTTMRSRLVARIEAIRGYIVEELRDYLANASYRREELERRIRETEAKISNLVDALAQAPSSAVAAKLRTLEEYLETLRASHAESAADLPQLPPTEEITKRVAALDELVADVTSGREMLRSVLVGERIDLFLEPDGYWARWSVRPGAFLQAALQTQTPSDQKAGGDALALDRVGCGGPQVRLDTGSRGLWPDIEFAVGCG